jgi:hypothetical protein
MERMGEVSLEFIVRFTNRYGGVHGGKSLDFGDQFL